MRVRRHRYLDSSLLQSPAKGPFSPSSRWDEPQAVRGYCRSGVMCGSRMSLEAKVPAVALLPCGSNVRFRPGYNHSSARRSPTLLAQNTPLAPHVFYNGREKRYIPTLTWRIGPFDRHHPCYQHISTTPSQSSTCLGPCGSPPYPAPEVLRRDRNQALSRDQAARAVFAGPSLFCLNTSIRTPSKCH